MPSEPGSDGTRLDKARDLLAEERYEEALESLEGVEGEEACFLAASALYELDRIDEARARCAEALRDEDWAEPRHLEALLQLQLAAPEKALEAAQKAVALDPDWADAHYAAGLAFLHLGRNEEADAAFERAASMDPEGYFRPHRLEADAFDEVVDEALSMLPEEFQEFLENVEVAVEEVPDAALIRDGVDFDVLGIYQGATIQAGDWGFPDRILLFQRNLENISPDRETLIEEIRDTVFHEVGHHMGMDEDAIRSAEEGSQES